MDEFNHRRPGWYSSGCCFQYPVDGRTLVFRTRLSFGGGSLVLMTTMTTMADTTTGEAAEPSADAATPITTALKSKGSILKHHESSTLNDGDDDQHHDEERKKKKKSVGFTEKIDVRILPAEEAEEAFGTRKGDWGAAPDHDELWDGDSKEFWEQEKTLEEVHRIVVMRQLRLTLQYNLGFAFYAMVANFKRRRNSLSKDDVVPEFETPQSEDAALRKELRELFQESVKGLEFADLMQDRIAFEKIHAAMGPGLDGIQKLIDEIMYVEDLCELMGVPITPPEDVSEPPLRTTSSSELPGAGSRSLSASSTATSAESAAIIEEVEKRRGDQRAAFEAQNNGVPPYGERRASAEARRLAESIAADQELAAAKVASEALPSVPEEAEVKGVVAVKSEVATTTSTEETLSQNVASSAVVAEETPSTTMIETTPESSSTVTASSSQQSGRVPTTGTRLDAKRFDFLTKKPVTATSADVRVFSEVFEGTTITAEDRNKYAQRFIREGITSIKQLAGLSANDLASMEVKVFDAKQIARKSWVVSRKI